MNWAKRVKGFRQRWVYMNTSVADPIFEVLTEAAMKSSSWGQRSLTTR
jgi:hypothetical protein